jgi:hypothetical protein
LFRQLVPPFFELVRYFNVPGHDAIVSLTP